MCRTASSPQTGEALVCVTHSTKVSARRPVQITRARAICLWFTSATSVLEVIQESIATRTRLCQAMSQDHCQEAKEGARRRKAKGKAKVRKASVVIGVEKLNIGEISGTGRSPRTMSLQ